MSSHFLFHSLKYLLLPSLLHWLGQCTTSFLHLKVCFNLPKLLSVAIRYLNLRWSVSITHCLHFLSSCRDAQYSKLFLVGIILSGKCVMFSLLKLSLCNLSEFSSADPKYVVAPVVQGHNNRRDIKQRVGGEFPYILVNKLSTLFPFPSPLHFCFSL